MSRGWSGRVLLVSAGAAAGLMLVEACSDAAGHMLVEAGTAMMDAGAYDDDDGGMLSDAGGLLRDAGGALVEAGSSLVDGGQDASAQPVASLYKSGSRIQMRVTMQNGADGSRYAGYPTPYDSQRNEGCSVTRTADGKVRCIPFAPALTANTPYFGTRDAPKSCTQCPTYTAQAPTCLARKR